MDFHRTNVALYKSLGHTNQSLPARAATFTRVNDTVSCFCNKRLLIGLPFTRTLPREQRRGLLIAFSNEHTTLDHQSVFFSDSYVFDKVFTAIRITAYMLNWQYLTIGSIFKKILCIWGPRRQWLQGP